MRNYSLSYSGGNDKSNYYVSAGVFDQDGIILNISYRRYTVQFNGESRVKPWIKFGNNLTLSHDEKKSGDYNIRMAMTSLPTQPITMKTVATQVLIRLLISTAISAM